MTDEGSPEAVLRIIELLQLAPHPEGGYYRQLFRSRLVVTGHPGGARAAATSIYFLLPASTFSAFHRVTSDEIWHHLDGDPVELHLLHDADGATDRHQVMHLGRDLDAGQRPVAIVPADALQAARPIRAPGAAGWSLCGCTVAPGFDFADFTMPTRDELAARFPEYAALIDQFTR